MTIEGHFDFVADLDLDFTTLVLELFDGNDGFGLESDVDDDHVGGDVDDEAREDHARTNALIRQALFEQLCK